MGPAFECAAGEFPLCHLSACRARAWLGWSASIFRSHTGLFGLFVAASSAPQSYFAPRMRCAMRSRFKAVRNATARESAEAVGCNRRGCCWRPRHGAPDIWCPSLPALQSGGMGLHVQGAAVRADTHVRPSRLSKPGSCCMLSGSVPQPLTRRADDCDCAAQEPRLEVGRPRGKHGLPPP